MPLRPEIEVISVHVPKCAGVSLRQVFENIYGKEPIYLDYADKPADPTSAMNRDPAGFFAQMAASRYEFLAGKEVVHGHFNIRKYDGISARWRITFLRDPVERVISHYFFWLTFPRHGHQLHDYLLDNKLTLEEFAGLPTIRGFYSSVFFSGVDMKRFDLIGFHDRLDEDFATLQSLVGIVHPLPNENSNTGRDYQEQREELLSDRRRMESLRDLLKDDVRFYDQALEAALSTSDT